MTQIIKIIRPPIPLETNVSISGSYFPPSITDKLNAARSKLDSLRKQWNAGILITKPTKLGEPRISNLCKEIDLGPYSDGIGYYTYGYGMPRT